MDISKHILRPKVYIKKPPSVNEGYHCLASIQSLCIYVSNKPVSFNQDIENSVEGHTTPWPVVVEMNQSI